MRFILVLMIIVPVLSSRECDKFSKDRKAIYSPLRHCQRSNNTVIGWQNVNSVGKCAEFAKVKRGMAFNYSPKGRRAKNRFENKTLAWSDVPEEKEDFYNCEVINCPESTNFTSLINDTRFDYYSLYAFPPRK